MLQKCEGIVIRSMDYGESNKIITIYTRELGKVGVMARGAKKPNSRLTSITQLFTYGTFMFQRSTGLGSLQQGETILSHRVIREDIFLTAYASYISELLDKSTENNEQNPFMFELLKLTLDYLDEDVDPDILINIFEMKMLPILGLSPQLDCCTLCGKKDGTFHFSIREGGFICQNCFEKDPYRLPISQTTVKLIRLFYYFDLNRLGNISVKLETKKELKAVIQGYYEEYAGLHLKSKRFLDQVESLKDKL
ncbi:DNA repair protein RecO [Metabacillus malikii]|uniref:DNA repair protein RecO n=1 Tax=Metabacillus malikii TaxID=1504265 RepID=A0ABT9ZI74_9BACI|nr:DNA repair protein RecO [Metabacillus malikii]MDQ0231604.1 DNA repair protein RecO (recombination protein O) [Metabacillus malikii]